MLHKPCRLLEVYLVNKQQDLYNLIEEDVELNQQLIMNQFPHHMNDYKVRFKMNPIEPICILNTLQLELGTLGVALIGL